MKFPSSLLPALIITCISCYISKAQGNFPDLWVGEYAGEMTLGNINKTNSSVSVKFSLNEVIKDSIWTHKMVFSNEEYGEITKNYVIRASAKGDTTNFVLDEQNGIEMEMSLMNNCFYGFYKVMGSTYITTLRRLDEQTLLWDLFVAPETSAKISKLTNPTDGTELEVESMKPSTHQTVFLSRVD